MSEAGYMTKPMSIKQYRKMKIRILEKDFCVSVTDEQKMHINTLQTESAIDRYCRTIIKNRWEA